jgi:hypothetical protein
MLIKTVAVLLTIYVPGSLQITNNQFTERQITDNPLALTATNTPTLMQHAISHYTGNVRD